MNAPRYRIGNDLSVFWAIHNRDGSPFDMGGMDVRLFVTNERGRKEVDVFLATLPDGTINNVIRWDFKGEDQRVLGLHTLTVEISESATHREIIRDYCQAFELVGRSELETEEGDANISIGGDLILSSKLDIYRFEATNVDLSGIKETIHDLNETIKDINEEAIEIKVTINGIQSQVNDIGTELTNKASVETVVEIGEQITEVQTNVAEQTIRVNSLSAEIATKASAESVTQIADELAITNESLAEQVIKVTDLTAEVSTKASSEMVTEISDNLKITNDTLAEQTLKVEALSSEISTKASAESVTDIADELAITNKSVAEQTLKVSALESEIATKASSESVLTLEGDVTAVEKAVAEQTIKVEGLEASIESKVSKEEFNEKTGELDTKYTNLKQTADNLTIEVGEQGESLTKVVADVNGLSVRVDDIGEAQVNYDNTLSELTDILTPEQMSTQVGKGVVLSTIIATRDADGSITAGMNASSVHSDPVHGRVVFAGGVKNKTDWTKATGILYEDGHIVMNSGEFGENVKIGNAMFRAVLEGDFDLFSYPENGTLVPLFQVNKDSNGKIVSISTPYDFTVNRNLVVFGDASSGDGGGGSSSVGIQGIKLNGTTYRDENSDGIIDLGTIGGGTLTEITYEMIVDALGYTPVSSASLGSLAYKNGLTASDIPDLSGIYLPTSGGFMNNMASIKWYANVHSWDDAPDGLIGVSMVSDALGYHGGLSYKGYYGLQIRAYGGDTDDISVRGYNHSAWGTWRTLYHSGNFNPANYLPLSGGTISGTTNGPLVVNTTNATEVGIPLAINSSKKVWFGYSTAVGGAYMYNAVAKRYMGILDDGSAFLGGNTILHSGNVGDYKAGDSDKFGGLQSKAYARCDFHHDTNEDVLTANLSGMHRWSSSAANMPTGGGYGNSLVVRGSNSEADTLWILYGCYSRDALYFRRGTTTGIADNDWKTIAFTDSNVASAQALTHSNGTVGATAYADGKVYFDNGVLLKNNSSGISALDANNGYRSILALGSDNNLYFGLNTQSDQMRIYGSPIRFFIGGTDAMRINTSGNVTIGASDLAGTSAKLHVAGNTTINGNLVVTGDISA